MRDTNTVVCVRCHTSKQVSEMRRSPRSQRGYYLYCAACDNAARRAQRAAGPKPERKELVRKLPPYQTLRKLYVDDGLSYADIAEKYDVNRSAVFDTLKRRAKKHGEWPLKSKVPVSVKLRRTLAKDRVAPDVIIGMVYDYLGRYAKQAGPRCAFCTWRLTENEKPVVGRHGRERWKTFWCDDGCMRLYFERRGIDPDTWKTKRVLAQHLTSPFNIVLNRFCRQHGFSPTYLKELHAGRYGSMSRDYAVRLLKAIGEDVSPALKKRRKPKYSGNRRQTCPSNVLTVQKRQSASTTPARGAGLLAS